MEQQNEKAFAVDNLQERGEIVGDHVDDSCHTLGIGVARVSQDLYDPPLEVGRVVTQGTLVTDLLQAVDKLEECLKVGRESYDG